MTISVEEFKNYFSIIDSNKEVYEDNRDRHRYIWNGWADTYGNCVNLILLKK